MSLPLSPRIFPLRNSQLQPVSFGLFGTAAAYVSTELVLTRTGPVTKEAAILHNRGF